MYSMRASLITEKFGAFRIKLKKTMFNFSGVSKLGLLFKTYKTFLEFGSINKTLDFRPKMYKELLLSKLWRSAPTTNEM